jgi:hypothetical protein
MVRSTGLRNNLDSSSKNVTLNTPRTYIHKSMGYLTTIGGEENKQQNTTVSLYETDIKLRTYTVSEDSNACFRKLSSSVCNRLVAQPPSYMPRLS